MAQQMYHHLCPMIDVSKHAQAKLERESGAETDTESITELEEERPNDINPHLKRQQIPIISVEYLQEKLRERNERLKQKEYSAGEECVPPPIPPPPRRNNHNRGEKKVELRNYDSLLLCCHPTQPTISYPRLLSQTGKERLRNGFQYVIRCMNQKETSSALTLCR